MTPAPERLKDPAQQQRGAYAYWVTEHVRWSDTDRLGHANHLAFGAFCETGRAQLLERFMTHDAEHPALLVLAELRLRFLSEAHWPDVVDVGTSVVSLGNRSCVMAQGLFVGERCIGVAEVVLVNIDATTRRPITIPDAARTLLLEYAPPA